jgi:hypothetical protein
VFEPDFVGPFIADLTLRAAGRFGRIEFGSFS